MTTSIHISADLLARLDVQASRHGLSRNHFIVQALRQTVENEDSWSEELLDVLRRPLSEEDAQALDTSLAHVRMQRRSKKAPTL